MFGRCGILGAALIVSGATAAGPADAQAPDPPDPGAPVGAVQTARADRAFDSYPLPIEPFAPGHQGVERIDGRVVWSAFRFETEASTVDILNGYKTRLGTQGFDTLFACATEFCGGFDFRFDAALLPPPAMLIDVADFVQLSLRRPEPEAYISVLISRVLGDVYIQTVTAVPATSEVAITDTPVAETAEETVILPVEERALVDRLLRDGHVPVAGLEFAPGGSALSERSSAALDMLARMLSRDSELAVVIVGHSDNQGGLDVNIELSRRRAESVMAALVSRGVPEGQLDARGIGYLAPVTNNATDDGRAANRRVELVLR
ncbi:MAG: OmpA family protein [Pseudomonadota bacterium]